MDRELARVLGAMLARHDAAALPAEEVMAAASRMRGWASEVAGVVPISVLMSRLIRRELTVFEWDDEEMYEQDLLPFDEILGRVSTASGGAWAPDDLVVDHTEDGEAVIRFTHRGMPVVFRIDPSHGDSPGTMLRAFDGFAARHLDGRMFPGEAWWFLPAALVRELMEFVRYVSREWPSAEQLVEIFRVITPPPEPSWDNPPSDWTAAVDCVLAASLLRHVNDLSASGERPLHVLAQVTRPLSEEVLRGERLATIRALIAIYGADPRLPDAAGMTAFDHARDGADGAEDAELVAALSVTPGREAEKRGALLWFPEVFDGIEKRGAADR